MTKKYKVSFLMAAHNEEKVIGESLDSLLKVPYDNYEVIVGLDGCTDGTEKIVRNLAEKNKKLKYVILNIREGKPAVIDEIIQIAKGDIVIINDADWIFQVKDKNSFEKFISVFENKKIGGIAESFPVEWHKDLIKNGNLSYLMEAYSAYFWYNFQKEKFTLDKGEYLEVQEPSLFMTNIFRKELYELNTSLADDFERTYIIMKKGYKIISLKNINLPRIKTVYTRIGLKDFVRQKTRMAIAREQMKNKEGFEIGMKNYYLPSIIYIFRSSWKRSFNVGLIIILWFLIMTYTTVIGKFKNKNTNEGWKMRLSR